MDDNNNSAQPHDVCHSIDEVRRYYRELLSSGFSELFPSASLSMHRQTLGGNINPIDKSKEVG